MFAVVECALMLAIRYDGVNNSRLQVLGCGWAVNVAGAVEKTDFPDVDRKVGAALMSTLPARIDVSSCQTPAPMDAAALCRHSLSGHHVTLSCARREHVLAHTCSYRYSYVMTLHATRSRPDMMRLHGCRVPFAYAHSRPQFGARGMAALGLVIVAGEAPTRPAFSVAHRACYTALELCCYASSWHNGDQVALRWAEMAVRAAKTGAATLGEVEVCFCIFGI